MLCSLSAIVEFNLRDNGSMHDAVYFHTRQHVCVDSQSSRFIVIQGSFLCQLEKKISPVDTENYLV